MSSVPTPFHGVATLSPAYFGMVMATGIVSLAAHGLSFELTAKALFYMGAAAYGAIGVLTLLRLLFYHRYFVQDLMDHSRAPGFFTSIAASNVLAMQCLALYDNRDLAWVLWGISIVLWLTFTYTIFLVLTVKREKPTLAAGINGGWLLAVVATQSVSMLSAQLAPFVTPEMRLEMNFFGLSMWLWGGMLYIWLMALIFYRYNFFHFRPTI